MFFRKILSAALLVVLFAAGAYAAEGGALSQVQSKRDTTNQATGAMGGGVGTDLKAIASPKKGTTTFTGFPAGTLPGGAQGAAGQQPKGPEGRVVFSGDPLDPLIGSAMVGSKLDAVCAIADHAGYSLVRQKYDQRSLGSMYTFRLYRGRQRLATLYFDQSLVLQAVN